MTLICHQRLSTAGLRIIDLHRLGKCHFSSESRHLRLLMKCRKICRSSIIASSADPLICRCHYSSSLPGTSADKFKLPDPIERDRQHWIQLLREEQRAIEQRAKGRPWMGGFTLECKMSQKWREGKIRMMLSLVGARIENIAALKKFKPHDPIELSPLGTSATESSSIFGKVKRITPDGHFHVLLYDAHCLDWKGVRFNVRDATDVHWSLEIIENGEEWHKMPGFQAMLWAYGCDSGEWPKTKMSTTTDNEEPHSLNMDEEIMRLDEHQRTALIAALDPSRPIVAVHGPPGTGKSMLAMEYVRAEIQAGKRVLVVCGSNSAMYSLAGHYLQRTSLDAHQNKNFLLHGAYDDKITNQLNSDPNNKKAIQCRTMKHLLEEKGSETIYAKYKETATKWKLRARSRIIRDCPLQFSTPSNVTISLIALAKTHFDVVVMEQANLINMPDSWAMILPLAPHVRLFGDSHQLARPILSEAAREQDFGRSLLQHLLEEKNDQQVNFHLHTQYRSHPAIHHWSNTVFYKDRSSEPAPSVANLGLAELLSGKLDSKRPENLITEPMVLIDTSLVGNREGGGGWAEWMFETKQGGYSFYNEGEVLLIACYLCLLHKSGFNPSQIAFFPQYTAQRNQIMDSLAILSRNREFSPTQILRPRDFMGRSFDIVLSSHVEDPRKIYKGLRYLQYLNQIITCTRRQFVLVANSKQLRESLMVKELDELVRTFEQKGRIMAPGELMPLRPGEFKKIMREKNDQYFDSLKGGGERRRDETRKRVEEMEDEEENNSGKRRWKEAEMDEEEKSNGRRRKQREEEDELEEDEKKKNGRRKMMREEEDEDWKSIAKRNQRTIANLEMKLRNREKTIEQLEMKLRDMRKMVKERGKSIWNLMEKLQERRRKTMESLELRDAEKITNRGSQENGKDDWKEEEEVEEKDEAERIVHNEFGDEASKEKK